MLVQIEMLKKKEKVLQKKVAAEVEPAKEFTRAKNKTCILTRMMLCLLFFNCLCTYRININENHYSFYLIYVMLVLMVIIIFFHHELM